METPKFIQSKPQPQAVELGLTAGLAALFLAALLWGLQGVIPAHADPGTLHVDGASGQDISTCGTTITPCQTIGYALDLASRVDTILVAQGTYTENLTINKSVTLMGGYEPISWTRNIVLYETIIDGSRAGSVVIFQAGSDGAVLDGFTITGGSGANGGGIYIDEARPTIASNTIIENTASNHGGGIGCWHESSPRIISNTITENAADKGGGVGCDHCYSAIIRDNAINDNTATHGGGIACDHSSPIIEDNIITDNTAEDGGGGIYLWNTSSPTIEGNTITRNKAENGGAIDCWNNSFPEIRSNTIMGNIAQKFGGGGISCCENSCRTIENNSISNNQANFGSGIYLNFSSPTIKDNTITKNRTLPPEDPDNGGGIFCDQYSSPIIKNNFISENEGVEGGGIYCDTYSSPEIVNNTIAKNRARGHSDGRGNGGGIFCWNHSSPSIMHNVICENEAVAGGGGIGCTISSSPAIISNTISENRTDGSGGGIGCTVNSSPQITNKAITGNQACWGGGILCHEDCSPSIENNVIDGNTAEYGGGISCSDNSSPKISNDTITKNTATEGGGIYCHKSSPIITNTILWYNGGTGVKVDNTGNPTIVYSDIEQGWPGEGNISQDPLFVGEGDYHLRSGSPCIDAGTDAGVYIDMDGDSRPQGEGFDIGADEYVPITPTHWIYLPLTLKDFQP